MTAPSDEKQRSDVSVEMPELVHEVHRLQIGTKICHTSNETRTETEYEHLPSNIYCRGSSDHVGRSPVIRKCDQHALARTPHREHFSEGCLRGEPRSYPVEAWLVRPGRALHAAILSIVP
jgi:hypothetical protein